MGLEALDNHLRLDRVVLGRGGAVGVQVVHLGSGDAGVGERLVQRGECPEAIGLWCRQVVGITGFAAAQQTRALLTSLQECKGGCLAQVDAAPVRVKRAARFRRHELQGVEAKQHAAAQGVNATHDHRVCQAQSQQTFAGGESFGAGGAGGGHSQAGAAEAQRLLHKR